MHKGSTTSTKGLQCAQRVYNVHVRFIKCSKVLQRAQRISDPCRPIVCIVAQSTQWVCNVQKASTISNLRNVSTLCAKGLQRTKTIYNVRKVSSTCKRGSQRAERVCNCAKGLHSAQWVYHVRKGFSTRSKCHQRVQRVHNNQEGSTSCAMDQRAQRIYHTLNNVHEGSTTSMMCQQRVPGV